MATFQLFFHSGRVKDLSAPFITFWTEMGKAQFFMSFLKTGIEFYNYLESPVFILSTTNFPFQKFYILLYRMRLYIFLWNNQQMQLYAVNFIPLLSSLYMFRVF